MGDGPQQVFYSKQITFKKSKKIPLRMLVLPPKTAFYGAKFLFQTLRFIFSGEFGILIFKWLNIVLISLHGDIEGFLLKMLKVYSVRGNSSV
jgi:hypothetical protein